MPQFPSESFFIRADNDISYIFLHSCLALNERFCCACIMCMYLGHCVNSQYDTKAFLHTSSHNEQTGLQMATEMFASAPNFFPFWDFTLRLFFLIAYTVVSFNSVLRALIPCISLPCYHYSVYSSDLVLLCPQWLKHSRMPNNIG